MNLREMHKGEVTVKMKDLTEHESRKRISKKYSMCNLVFGC